MALCNKVAVAAALQHVKMGNLTDLGKEKKKGKNM